MTKDTKSILIIGAGIAGLTAGVYAQRAGFQSQILEMHTIPGGLVTAWKRKGYTIDGCIHWLTWSNPKSSYERLWQEIGLLHGQEIFNPEIFQIYEGQNGKTLIFYTDLDLLEKHLIELSPEDRIVIHEICGAARSFSKLDFQAESGKWSLHSLVNSFQQFSSLIWIAPGLLKYSGMTLAELAEKFKSPFLKEVFTNVWAPEISAVALLSTLGFLHMQTAGYPIGGSLPMAQGAANRYLELGGEIRYGCRVVKILVEDHSAVGVLLEDGSQQRADYIISAMDGRSTIFDLLEGQYADKKTNRYYSEYPVFPPILHAAFGVNRSFNDFPRMTGGLSIPVTEPLEIAGKQVDRLGIMINNYDPTMAPAGQTVVTCVIPTEYQYWKDLAQEPEQYQAEKERVGMAFIRTLNQRFPGFANEVQMVDIATPVTFERYTGNWKGSFEGFLPTPLVVRSGFQKTLPGLNHFIMAGQWVQAGGGLPSGLITGRLAIQKICKQEKVRFI